MTGHVAKKRGRWYAIVEFGYQPSRRCAHCRHLTWTWDKGELSCEKCDGALEDPVDRRRQKWHGSWTRRADAKEALTDLLGKVQAGVYVAPKKLTFAEFVEREWLPALQVRPSTAFSYTRNMRLHVLPAIGPIKLQAITPAHLNALYRQLLVDGNQHRKGDGLSLRTVRYVHTILHRALGDAVRWNLLSRNVADHADPPRAKDAQEATPEMRTWEGHQLAAFLRWAADDRYGPAFHVLATTGMRRGELLGLRWEDVDLEGAKLRIRRTRISVNHEAQDGQTKTGRPRTIELDAGTISVLRVQRARQAQDRLLLGAGYPASDFVFTHPDGQPFHPERFSREFDRKLATYNRLHVDAPLPRIRTHDLRHTWATLALKAGLHPKIVAERLGHTTTNVTLNVYSHVVAGMQSEAAETVASLIFGAS